MCLLFITHHSKHDVVHERCWEQEQQNSKCQGSHKQLVWWVLAWINTSSQGVVFPSQEQPPQGYQSWYLQAVQSEIVKSKIPIPGLICGIYLHKAEDYCLLVRDAMYSGRHLSDFLGMCSLHFKTEEYKKSSYHLPWRCKQHATSKVYTRYSVTYQKTVFFIHCHDSLKYKNFCTLNSKKSWTGTDNNEK